MKLFIVATPIGNLGDVTFRAIENLKNVDVILCEDTRMTKRLLDRYEIQKPLLSYHQRSRISRVEKIIEHLESGKNLALVTDAGTPGISDPGNELVGHLVEYFGEKIEIIPIPGPSALTSLISASGVSMSKFLFLGFPPNKKGRETFFSDILKEKLSVVYYDSPHRFLKNLMLLKELNKKDDDKEIFLIVGRELTKIYEEIRRGSLEEILEHYSSNPDKVKGEFVVAVIGNKKGK